MGTETPQTTTPTVRKIIPKPDSVLNNQRAFSLIIDLSFQLWCSHIDRVHYTTVCAAHALDSWLPTEARVWSIRNVRYVAMRTHACVIMTFAVLIVPVVLVPVDKIAA